jgi:1,2-diacylglycerol 3-alpha-glucosyltransferase
MTTFGQFSDGYLPILDGVAQTVHNYAYWLQKKWGDTHVIAPDNINSDADQIYKVLKYFSVPIPFHRPYRLGIPQLDNIRMHEISQIPFDLIHCHTPFSAGGLGLRIARERNIPIVGTFHSKYREDILQVLPSQRIADFVAHSITSFYEKMDEVWIPEASSEKTLRDYGFHGPTIVMENGVDFSRPTEDLVVYRLSCRKALQIGIDKKVFLYVGQHDWKKNLRLLIDALNQLGDIPYIMIFVGEGPAEKEMQNRVINSHLSNKARFMGPIRDREKMREVYGVADLFLFPSLYDNSPLAIREAACMNIPSILLASSTIAEQIQDGVNGFLAGSTSIEYAEKIRTILKLENEKIQYVGRQASQTLSKPWEMIVDKAHDRYMNLIQKNRA